MIIPEKRVCDFCGRNDPMFCDIKLPVVTNCEWTEGRSTKRHIELEKYDICEECLIKATNILCDFRGQNSRIVGLEAHNGE